jgi:hypothetical protein
MELAQKLNQETLPLIPSDAAGVYLPDREHLLTKPNYRVDSTTAVSRTFVRYRVAAFEQLNPR